MTNWIDQHKTLMFRMMLGHNKLAGWLFAPYVSRADDKLVIPCPLPEGVSR